jgi:plasmid segregation protein ParM
MIGIDIGYSTTKVFYNGDYIKIPSAVSFANDTGIEFGSSDFYEFEGQKYNVGERASNDESFVTTSSSFIAKFGPLIIYHVFNKLGLLDKGALPAVRSGLALVDWNQRAEFIERLSTVNVNGTEIKLDVTLIPQGAGVGLDFVFNAREGVWPETLMVLDIGYNTINVLNFQDGEPVRNLLKSYPGHGVSSIIAPFKSYLENKFRMKFSEQEAIKIFVTNKFVFNGENQTEIVDKVQESKIQFVQKMFNSVLASEKKQMSTSTVLIGGGGAYFLDDIEFGHKDLHFPNKPYEFANVRGYVL